VIRAQSSTHADALACPENPGVMEAPIPLSTRITYAMGSLAYGIKDNGFSVFLLLFYNQVVGLDAGLVGLMLFFALLADALIDPMVGHLSDRTRTRWGRRHPWLYASAIPIAVFWVLLWIPPEIGQTAQLVWLFVFATLVRMSLSFNEVPSIAMAPEMTSGYHERTSLLGLRYLFGWSGGLIILALAYGYFKLADPGNATRNSFYAYAITGAVVMFGSILISAIGTHSRFAKPSAAGAHQPTMSDMIRCLKFKPFLILLLAAFFAFANQGIGFSLSSYLLNFIWLLGPQQQVFYALTLFVGVLAALFVARYMGMRYGKRGAAIRLALSTCAVATLPYILFVAGWFPTSGTPSAMAVYFAMVMVSTSTGVALFVTASSMMADVTSEFQKISGLQQEGVFFAGYFFMQKCVTGVGILVAGQILSLIDFPENASMATVSSTVTTALAQSFIVMTLLLGLGTAWAMSHFPKTDEAAPSK
jgi:glycoside/pentoside/hexuronide:cation symporter, GPH family